jgi:hypothetical protein
MSFVFGGGVSGPATSVVPGVMNGWQDWNDAATASSPIALSATPADLTNDGAGPFTNLSYRVNGHGNIWNTSTNRFDWTSLNLGDTVDVRIDVSVTTAGPNTDVSIAIDLAIGSGGDYTLGIDRRTFKNSGTFQIVRWYSVYMGDTNTLNNPAKFTIKSDGTGDTAVVNGWYVRTMVR